MKRKIALFIACLLIALSVPCSFSYAKSPTDEILNYIISVDVNDDATLSMKYHIEWKVLYDGGGSDYVSWVTVGVPNDHCLDYRATSDNISKIKLDYSNGTCVRIDFNKKYYKDDIITFDFEITQDYMYEMNALTEGESVFYFTPGWFDDIAVDNIEVYWSSDDAIGWSHGAILSGGYLMWSGALGAGEQLKEISVTYSTDSFAFDESKYFETDSGSSSYYDDDDDDGDAILGLGVLVALFLLIKAAVKKTSYSSGSGLSGTTTKKKVTRTLIKYYPTCPGCGAARPENKDKCDYCGRSFIESEEVIEEKDITEPKKYSDEGTYRYGSDSNTYVRVHVTHVHVPATVSHSSCAHSSCACAHSCACACACACAGGGRAGCSTKDFYNTNLKLKQLEMRKEKK